MRWINDINKQALTLMTPLVSADDFYDEEKYRKLLLKAAEEVLGAWTLLNEANWRGEGFG